MKSQTTNISRAATTAAAAILILANACVSSSTPLAFATFHQTIPSPIDKKIAYSFDTKNTRFSTINQKSNDLFMQQSYPLKNRLTALNMVEDEEKDYVSPMRQRPPPKGGDIAYTNENILRQLRYYNDIRKVGGKDCVQDIYVRDPNTSVGGNNNFRLFWFVGKVARCTGTVSPELAVARLFNLIEEHATRIRPIELGRSFGSLEFYVAPGDTEFLTSQNDPGIRLEKMPRSVDGAEEVAMLEVGLNLEILTNQGAGFCIVRTEDGVVPPHLIGS